jgi:hypothetical protein
MTPRPQKITPSKYQERRSKSVPILQLCELLLPTINNHPQSPSNYDRLKANSLDIYPLTGTLQNLASKVTAKEGLSPKVYAWFRDQLDFSENMDRPGFGIGIFYFDEMKLKSGIYNNMKYHASVGIASSNLQKNNASRVFGKVDQA